MNCLGLELAEPFGEVKVIRPVVAPVGTTITAVVPSLDSTEAVVPFTKKVPPLKLAPVTVTCVPIGPKFGVKLVMLGLVNTVKLVELVTLPALVVITIGPVVAPTGTVTCAKLPPKFTTVAAIPLIVMVGSTPPGAKFEP